MPLSYYTLTQWSLLFYLYGFLGWVWESCYVSLCRRQWVNRGFLHGPMLPIYGFGALMILLATLPVRQNLALVFLLGTASATLLEYVTGAAMERIFHVRYWDYSHQRFQVKGYICLRSSIAWGFFSILLVRVLHPPLEDAVLALPTLAAQILSLGLTVCFGADVGASAREAFDLKELLEKAAENNASLASLEAQLQQLSDAAESRSEAFREGMRAWQLRLKEQAEALRWQSDANRAAGRQYLNSWKPCSRKKPMPWPGWKSGCGCWPRTVPPHPESRSSAAGWPGWKRTPPPGRSAAAGAPWPCCGATPPPYWAKSAGLPCAMRKRKKRSPPPPAGKHKNTLAAPASGRGLFAPLPPCGQKKSPGG